MFTSAILKLTGWYLLILMTISLLFSVAIYSAASNEVQNGLMTFQTRVESPGQIVIGSPNHDMFSQYRGNQIIQTQHRIFMTLVYINLLILACGGILSYFLAKHVMRDIEEAHEAQSRFTSDASHELRTPLAAMKSELEATLASKSETKDSMREILHSTLEEVDKLTALSDMLLRLSKLKRSDILFVPTDLKVATAEVAQRYDKNMKRIVIDQPKAELVTLASQSSVEELITILVDNALKYSTSGTKIHIKLSGSSDHLVFRISSKGKVINPKDLPHIFDRFYRSSSSRSDAGYGLGLSLAKEIVQLHKGELQVSSQKGGITEFSFALPKIDIKKS